MVRRAIAVWLAVASVACGARSGLGVEGRARDAEVQRRDAGTDAGTDAGRPERPDCGEAVPVGAVRATVEGVDARVAIGPDDNLYTLREVDEAWHAVSLDPCLRERWSTPVPGLRRLPRVMVDARGEVWILGQGEPGYWRFSSDGRPLETALPFEGLLFTWIGVPRDGGPVYASSAAPEEKYLHRASLDGRDRRVRLETPSSFVYDGECGLSGDLAACWNVAYDRRTLEQRFYRGARIVDGTFRHVLPPAFDGRRAWSVEFGISTYRLVSIDLTSGERVVETTIMRTERGQTELLIGPPVITARGDVAVYVHGTREAPPGALEVYAPDGTLRWTFAAPRAPRTTPAGGAVFSGEATHLVGRAGLLYLAMGETVYAIDARDGTERWRLGGLGDVNEAGVNLSTNGDLYVRDASGLLSAIATESFGLAASPWPIPGGNAGLSNAR